VHELGIDRDKFRASLPRAKLRQRIGVANDRHG
jgi:hypothetical protein